MNILVTGGAGLIGSHLISRLLTEGHHITCLDNYSTGDAGNTSTRICSGKGAKTCQDLSKNRPKIPQDL